jgi:hypothetical protein
MNVDREQLEKLNTYLERVLEERLASSAKESVSLEKAIESYVSALQKKLQSKQKISYSFINSDSGMVVIVTESGDSINVSITEIDTKLEDIHIPGIVLPDLKMVTPGSTALGKHGSYREYGDTIVVKSPQTLIRISNPRGNTEVSGWHRDDIIAYYNLEIDAPSRARETELLELSGLRVEQSGKTIRVESTLPTIHDPGVSIITSNLIVKVPLKNHVEITGGFGEVTASGLYQGVNVNARNATVTLTDIERGATVTNSMGTLVLNEVLGPIQASNSYSPIEVIHCSGSMVIKNAYDNIRLVDSEGDVSIENSGKVTVLNHYGEITIENSNGRVEVINLEGNVTAHNAFQPLVVSNIDGWVVAGNTNSLINASDVAGHFYATNRFGVIEAVSLGGPVKLENQNGNISLVLTGPIHGNSLISTTFGTINLAVPEQSDLLLMARTDIGDIQSTFPISIIDQGTNKTAELKFGRASDSLSITGTNASIIISQTQ